MEENGEVEVRIPGQVANQGEAGDGRGCHDAVGTDFFGLVGPVQELEAVGGAVGDVHALFSCLFLGIGKGHDALEHPFFKGRVVLVHEAVVIFDDGAAAQGQVVHHFGQFLGASAQGLDGAHEDGAPGHAAEVTESRAAEAGAGVVVIHGFRKVEGHEFDTGLEACISEEHIQKLRHFISHGGRVIGNGGVVGAGLGFFQVFYLAYDGVTDGGSFHQFIGAFHGLFYADAEGQFFCLFVVGGRNAVGGGETGRLGKVFLQLFKKFAFKKGGITHNYILPGRRQSLKRSGKSRCLLPYEIGNQGIIGLGPDVRGFDNRDCPFGRRCRRRASTGDGSLFLQIRGLCIRPGCPGT